MQQPVSTVAVARLAPQSLLLNSLLIVGGSLLIALSAYAQVPGPVPFTMQTFAVLLVAGLLGRSRGSAAVLAYLLEGAAGLPVFANGSAGPAYFAGPTGGYLIGFLAAAWIAGWMMEGALGRHVVSTFLACLVGHVIIVMSGFAWLAFQVGAGAAFQIGIAAFVLTAILKSALSAVALVGMRPVRARLNS